MAFRELDSFICKFRLLRQEGGSAHLDIDAHAGEAWVGLCVCLGHAPVPKKVNQNHSKLSCRNRDSPPRQRRRARRAAAGEQEQAVQTVGEAEEAVALENLTENAPTEETQDVQL